MKLVMGCLIAVTVLSLSFATSRAVERASTPDGEQRLTPGSQPFVGRQVKVYFRQDEKISVAEIPGGNLSYLSGNVVQADPSFVTLSTQVGDTVWIPLASIAYVRADDKPKTPTTMPN